jgi:hypothetical protein
MKLLCITANLAFNLPSLSNPIIFNGLKHSNKYRESILNGLWNYEKLNKKTEELFNQWIYNQTSKCSICYLFNNNNNKNENDSLLSIRYLLMSDEINISNDLLQCSDCYISVHRECYENLCLALNVRISDEYQQWFCQRCSLKKQVI